VCQLRVAFAQCFNLRLQLQTFFFGNVNPRHVRISMVCQTKQGVVCETKHGVVCETKHGVVCQTKTRGAYCLLVFLFFLCLCGWCHKVVGKSYKTVGKNKMILVFHTCRFIFEEGPWI